MRITGWLVLLGGLVGLEATAQEETPSPALLVLHKGENAMAIVDPATGKIFGHAPTGATRTSWPSRPTARSLSPATTGVGRKGATRSR